MLELVARRLAEGQGVASGWFQEADDFLARFVNRCHHVKEEHLLFPRLSARSLGRHESPLGALLQAHDSSRALVATMRAATAHIGMEDEVLFDVADQLLQPDDRAELVRAFAQVERDLGGGAVARWSALLDRIAVAVSESRPAGAGSGDSHARRA